MLRLFLAVVPSLAVGLLLATLAFGGAWTGFEYGSGYAASVAALSAGSLLAAAVIATVALPPARVAIVASAQALPMLFIALMMQASWGWTLFAAVAAAAVLGAWLGPWVFGRLPAPAPSEAPAGP